MITAFRHILLGLLLSLPVVAERPSVLFVLVDDLGWMDLAVQGNTGVRTPHVDRFAAQGLRFTDAYAAAPVCSPTRAALATGQAPARLGITTHIPDSGKAPEGKPFVPAACKTELPLETVTVAERFRDAGYRTAFFGKWHLSPRRKGKEAFEPDQQGYEVNVGGNERGGPASFFDPYRNPNLKDRKAGEYLPDRLGEEVLDWMSDLDDDEPFFISLWYYTVHWPFEAPNEYLERYKDQPKQGWNDYRYAAMIEAMDAAFGRLMSGLEKAGRAENTIVVFTSDNGGFSGGADCRPLRAAKGHLYEGGIRVPQIVRWPGVTKPGSVTATPSISMDWVPTLMNAAGIAPTPNHPIDGVDLRPVLDGGTMERTLYFHYPNYAWHKSNRLGSVIREGRWKLIERFDTGQLELFDLTADLGEKNDLVNAEPVLAKRLAAKLASWREDVGAQMPTRVE